MSYRDPYSDDERLQTGRRMDPIERTSPRRALWSAITALAVVVVLFIVFYSINAQRDEGAVATRSPPTTMAPPATTGQGGAPQLSGAPKQGAPQSGPAGEGAK